MLDRLSDGRQLLQGRWRRRKPKKSVGVIREVIVFVEEPSDSIPTPSEEDFFAEMEPFMVKVGGADYSRESIYTRMEGE